MGIVWRAHDDLLDRTVAVKEVLHRAMTDEDRADFNRRTIREARAAGRLTHPNVVVVHDVIEEDGRPWIVMQLVEARSLGDVIKTHGPLTPERVAAIGAQVLDALRTAHRAGVLHRDVKPENVLLGDDGRVVLTDFGIATMTHETALTMTGALSGTPAFMPPERLNGLPAVPASDLWSLGATLYAAVEGRPPFDRGAPVATMAAVLHDPPQAVRRAGPLAPVLEGLLRKEPERRMAADEADHLLRAVAAGEPAPRGYGTHTTPVTPKPPRRSGALRAVLVTVPLALVAAGVAVWYALSGMPGPGQALPTADAAISTPPPTSAGPTEPTPTEPTSSAASPSVPTPSPSTTSGATPSPSSPPPSPGGDQNGKLPLGWTVHADPGGFSIALPKGWAEFQREPTRVKFHGPGSPGYLQVDWTAPEDSQPDPVKALEDLESRVIAENKFSGYKRVRIAPVTYLGVPAGDWEFTWRMSAGAAHVLDRTFRTADGRHFAVYWQTLDSRWVRDLRLFTTFASTFQPS